MRQFLDLHGRFWFFDFLLHLLTLRKGLIEWEFFLIQLAISQGVRAVLYFGQQLFQWLMLRIKVFISVILRIDSVQTNTIASSSHILVSILWSFTNLFLQKSSREIRTISHSKFKRSFNPFIFVNTAVTLTFVNVLRYGLDGVVDVVVDVVDVEDQVVVVRLIWVHC